MAVARGCGTERRTEIGCHGAIAYQENKNAAVNRDTFYDLASLTKPLATLASLLVLIREEKLSLDDELPTLLERKVPEDKRKITLAWLLGHSSGLPPLLPFYQLLAGERRPREKIIESILATPLQYKPGKKAIYSDLGYILAGEIVTRKGGEDLAEFSRRRIFAPLGVADKIFYLKAGSGAPENCAWGEYCGWRRRLLRGEVGDENCAFMGGVAGHAGLFATIDGVMAVLAHYLDLYLDKLPPATSPLFSRSALLRCGKRQADIATTWALGFDTPAAHGSSAGDHLSAASMGHLGYSGTSFWLDPARELIIVLLSNRVHPSRHNERIKKFRPLFHNTICRMLKNGNFW